MHVLGIETSCDETAAAVITDGRLVRSNVVSSSLALHKKYGGIVPEIAFRRQLETITEVVDCALSQAGLTLRNIGLVAVTDGPGLLGSLLVGISFAKALCLSKGLAVVGVDHLYSHIYAPFLNGKAPVFPYIALVVSGGHTSLYLCKDLLRIERLGSTRDDACGEAFDKVAKILGLGYPGGPAIEKAARRGNSRKVRFSCSNTKKPYDFSFSGIKTAVLYYVRKHGRGSAADVADICASFQETVVAALLEKSFACCKKKRIRALVVGGGVTANAVLREQFNDRAQKENIELFFPSKEYCMDNAAMVAGLGYHVFKKGARSDLRLTARLTERG